MVEKYETLQKDNLAQTKAKATSKAPPPQVPQPKAAVVVAPAPKAAATPVPSNAAEDMELGNLLEDIDEEPDPMGHGIAIIGDGQTRKVGALLSSEIDNGDPDGNKKKARVSIQARNPLNVPAVCTPNGFNALATPATSVASVAAT